ncbi:hypothetical protein D1815_10380 [Aquimarina sp. AD1]|uniref:hypothetical protein n=1 Tax=Aquimarina sp. (strain AD1) TaxID=1714848 RepID=UPI000E51D4C4|nr:hypothetical protein [Aquimarina sp. AD1]AXT56139.1 hypothetical protein D1815_10380 [Aquimarina sp. AD1]RKN26878.1 hypothetical protein D7035_09300 [Aquimarina sp. AD1]
MGQDIRELLKQDNRIPSERLSEGHQNRFMARLEEELPKKARKFNYGWLRIAASVVVILSISMFAFNDFGNNNGNNTKIVDTNTPDVKNATVVLSKQTSSLAEMFPEYEKTENYLLTGIKFQLSQINVDDSNRELVESFMKRLENLNREYQDLNKELIEIGPNEQSAEAMIENLTLRLSLLKRLKDKLKELEKIENENYIDIQA